MAGYNAIDDFVLDQLFGYQTATWLKNNIVAAFQTKLEKNLGGSRETSVLVNGTFDVVEYRDIDLAEEELTGLTHRARVEGKTANATTSVTPIIRNVTDGTDLATGTAITATSFTEQLLAMTLPEGASKRYRLRGQTNNATNEVWLLGVCETYV